MFGGTLSQQKQNMESKDSSFDVNFLHIRPSLAETEQSLSLVVRILRILAATMGRGGLVVARDLVSTGALSQ